MIVVDENGNEISSTYVKRAKGLVKKGRARFIDENKICLTYDSGNPCPPSIDLNDNSLEDNEMDEKIIINNGAEEMNYADKANLTIEEIVARIDAIASDKDYLTNAIESLSLITDGGAPGDIAGQAKAQALGEAVAAREETNQRLIEFYTKVYNDIVGSKSQTTLKDQAFEIAKLALDHGMDEDTISDILNSIRDFELFTR